MSIKKTNRHKKHANVRKWAKEHQKEIYDMYNNQCVVETCKSKENLTIHHKEYKTGFEYVEVRCQKCHRNFHNLELKKKLLKYMISYLNGTYSKDMLLKDIIQDLNKKFSEIPVYIVPGTEKFDGLPF